MSSAQTVPNGNIWINPQSWSDRVNSKRMTGFSYNAPAELFVATTLRKNSSVRYVRFDTAADAIRHAIEDLPPIVLRATVMEVAEQRYDARAIQELYDSDAYPLARAQDRDGL